MTGSETNMIGFNVWRRGKGKANGWQKLNALVIAAKNVGQPMGTDYSYSDASVQAGKTYRYKLEVLGTDGSSSWSKIIKVKVQ